MYRNSDSSVLSLADARVLVVGMGALGCAAAWALARAGVGRLTLIDSDLVEASNLQRQVLFDAQTIGHPKVNAAADALAACGLPVKVVAIVGRVDACSVDEFTESHDFVIDATDDPPTKLLLNEAAVRHGRPFSYGGVVRTGGQTMAVAPGQSACLECALPAPEGPEQLPGGCSEAGILAPVAGVIGSLQAAAAVRALTRSPAWRPGTMILYEVRGSRWRAIEFSRRPDCRCCGGAAAHAVPARRQQTCHS